MVSCSSISVLMLLFIAIDSSNIVVHAISCQGAITRMLPCQAFLMGVGGITVPCCQSVQSLSLVANTSSEELKTLCQCLKQAALLMGINVPRAQQVPQLCHIDFNAGLIDPNVDCNKLVTLKAPTPVG